MDEYCLVNFKRCPNCDELGFERLPTHSHCVMCNHSPAYAMRPDSNNMIWAIEYLKHVSESRGLPADGFTDDLEFRLAVAR